jgi:hypothetical protein
MRIKDIFQPLTSFQVGLPHVPRLLGGGVILNPTLMLVKIPEGGGSAADV